MKDWKEILFDIYTPDIGTLLAAPNNIWTNSFAANKAETGHHPAVIGRVSSCKTNCNIVPGTTKAYKNGCCVYKVKIDPIDPKCPLTHFLIDFWMTFSKSDLMKLKQGWNGISILNIDQLKDFKQQIKFCKGIDV